MTEYVAGFMFRDNYREVALITKARPDWMRGKLNAIGGKIEPGETPIQAMCREFCEETQIATPQYVWREFCVLNHTSRYGIVWFFTANQNNLEPICGVGDEPVNWYNVELLQRAPTMNNLKWLVPLARDQDQVHAVVQDRSMT